MPIIHIQTVFRAALAMLLAAVVLLVPAAAAAPVAEPVIQRDDLDDNRFLDRLNEYGMTELVETYLADHPAGDADTADGLVKMIAARRAAGDWKTVFDAYKTLTTRHVNDPRIHQWRADYADLLINNRIRPLAQRVMYELTTDTDLETLDALVAESDRLVAAGEAALKTWFDEFNKLAESDVNAAERAVESGVWGKHNQLRNNFSYLGALTGLYKAQLLWARGVKAGAPDYAKLTAAADAAAKFFAPHVDQEHAQLRTLARMYRAQAHLFAGKYLQASSGAEQVIEDPKNVDPVSKFNAYVVKARALREEGQFGGSPLLNAEDVANWQALVNELFKASGQTLDSPAKRAFNRLPKPTQDAVKAAGTSGEVGDELKGQLITGLNKVLGEKDFYAAKAWQRFPLPAEQAELADKASTLTGVRLAAFNRAALSAGLPGGLIARMKLGAQAVLAEQGAFIDASPALRSVPQWSAFNLFMTAKTMIAEAEAQAADLRAKAANERKSGNEDQAKALEKQAGDRISAASSQAFTLIEDRFREAEDKETKQIYDGLLQMLLAGPSGAAANANLPDEPITPGELEGKLLYQLKRDGDQAFAAEKYVRSTSIFEHIVEKLEAEPLIDAEQQKRQMADALYELGRSRYFQAEKISKEGMPAEVAIADELFKQAAGAFRKLMEQFPNQRPRGDLLKFIASSLLRVSNKYADVAVRDRLLSALEEYRNIAKDDEFEDFQLYLAEVKYKAGRYRDAAADYNKISPKSEFYDAAQQYRRDAILKAYSEGEGASSPTTMLNDIATLEGYGKLAAPRIAELRKEADAAGDAEKAAELRAEADFMYRLGAEFGLEAGRLYYTEMKDSARALRALDQVTSQFRDLPKIKGRARGYKVSILLGQDKIEEATAEVLALLREDPGRANRYILDVLDVIEDDYKKLRAERRDSQAEEKARQAHDLAEALVAQARAEGESVPTRDLHDYITRLARTKNWLGQYQQARDLLEPIYAEIKAAEEAKRKEEEARAAATQPDASATQPDAEAEGQRPTFDVHMVIELADARYHTGAYDDAVELYNLITRTWRSGTGKAAPPRYDDLWWRALIGQAACNLQTEEGLEPLRLSRQALVFYRTKADELQGSLSPNADRVALPQWLVGWFNEVYGGLDTKVKSLTVEEPDPAADARQRAKKIEEEEVTGTGARVLMLVSVAAIGLIFLVFLFVQTTRKARAEAERKQRQVQIKNKTRSKKKPE